MRVIVGVVYATTLVAFSLTFPTVLCATREPSPKVNSETIKGTWEAIRDQAVQVFRMEIYEPTQSFLVMSGSRTARVLKLVDMTVKAGSASMTFKDINEIGGWEMLVKVSLQGRATKEWGVLDGKMIITDLKSRPQSTWRVRFRKMEPSFLQVIHEEAEQCRTAVPRNEAKR